MMAVIRIERSIAHVLGDGGRVSQYARRPMTARVLLLTCLCATGCALASDPIEGEQESGVTQYVSIVDFPAIDQGAWYDAAARVNHTFTASGEHAGITPLTLSCAVTSKLGVVHECAWTFATSEAAVDPHTAALAFDSPTFQCRVHPKTTAAKLVAFLASTADPLHDPLPGGPALADGLADCFQHPIGATPLAPVVVTSPTYVAASAYYSTASYRARWQSAIAALVAGFDNICGDTFCGSDYGDLHALQLECAVTKSTGNVKSCAWVFGGSFSMVATDGSVNETSRTFRCAVPVKATLAQLADTWVAAGTDDALHRTLPGSTTTAYDALGGCLP
jgi:hypothetical protein